MTQKTNLLFVGGDLSGIQRYIYNITSKKAAVSLKGRSAWLNKFMTEVHDELIEQLKQAGAETEKVYCSGGKFYFITTDTEQNRQIIQETAKDCEDVLWNDHYAQVAIAIEYVEFDFAADKVILRDGKAEQPFSALFDEISKLFAKSKNKKFSSYISEHYKELFEPQSFGGEKVKVCAVTGIEDTKCEKIDDDSDELVTPEVKKQKKIGEDLRDLDDENDNHKTFEDYADGSYIAILRMDVDNLGASFRSMETQEKYKQHSQNLDKFFTYKIKYTNNKPSYSDKTEESVLYKIWKEQFKDDMTIIYAGGDDIFIVGKWHKVIEFAATIQEQFIREFNPKNDPEWISLSGGVAIVKPKFPIAKAAELAAEAEESSKNFKHCGRKKNAFTMFGVTISWNNEFNFVKEYKDEFVKHYKENNMPTSILHRIMLLNEKRKQHFDNEKKKRDLSYYWHTVYFLTRLRERGKKELYPLIDGLQNNLLNSKNNERNFELVSLAARWAEITLRESKQY